MDMITYVSFLIKQENRAKCVCYLPVGQSVIQDRVTGPQNKHNVKPPLREEVTPMVINNLASLFHFVLHLIYELQQRYKVVVVIELFHQQKHTVSDVRF